VKKVAITCLVLGVITPAPAQETLFQKFGWQAKTEEAAAPEPEPERRAYRRHRRHRHHYVRERPRKAAKARAEAPEKVKEEVKVAEPKVDFPPPPPTQPPEPPRGWLKAEEAPELAGALERKKAFAELTSQLIVYQTPLWEPALPPERFWDKVHEHRGWAWVLLLWGGIMTTGAYLLYDRKRLRV
jgi:hypothetical protein